MEVGSEPAEPADSTRSREVAHPPHGPIRSLSNRRQRLFPTAGSEALGHMIVAGSDKKEEGKFFFTHLLQQCIAFRVFVFFLPLFAP